MARVLVIITPTFVVLSAASALTAPHPMGWFDGLLFALMLSGTLASYALNRTRNYLRGTVLLSWVGTLSSVVIAVHERELMRSQASLLFGLTAVVYAAFTLPAKKALSIGLTFCVLATLVALDHPSLNAGDFTLAAGLVWVLSGLTLAGARQRHLQDVELKASEQELKNAAGRMRATLDSALDTIAVVDPRGDIVDWGQPGEQLFGWSRAHVVGRKFDDLVLPGTEPDNPLRKALAACLTAPPASGPVAPAHFEVQLCTHGGRSFPAEVAVASLPFSLGAAVFMRDITERRNTQGRLMETDRMESLGRLVASMAHELNNPLAFVTSNLSSLEQDLKGIKGLPEDTAELLSDTREGVRRVQRIVGDLVTYGREDVGVPRPVDIERPLEFALQLSQPEIKTRGVNITRRYTDADLVMANEGRLGQVFLTIITNAVQAIDPHAAKKEILITRDMTEARRVRVRVTDSGSGMTPEVKGQLFTPFFSTKRPGKGVGLGLYVARNVILAAGGTIAVESEAGQGTTVTVELPVASADVKKP